MSFLPSFPPLQQLRPAFVYHGQVHLLCILIRLQNSGHKKRVMFIHVVRVNADKTKEPVVSTYYMQQRPLSLLRVIKIRSLVSYLSYPVFCFCRFLVFLCLTFSGFLFLACCVFASFLRHSCSSSFFRVTFLVFCSFLLGSLLLNVILVYVVFSSSFFSVSCFWFSDSAWAFAFG